MARFQNRATGGVVNVPAEKGKRLGSEWEPADVKPKSEPKTRGKQKQD